MNLIQKTKKAVSTLLVFGALSTALVAAPTAPAQAGLIFLPTGVGIVFLVAGIIYEDPLFIILDTQGDSAQDRLAAALYAKYPQINDVDVASALAAKLREKAASIPANSKDEKLVILTRAELSAILSPTGLEEGNPAAFARIVAEFQ
jgi:hypothetical protein